MDRHGHDTAPRRKRLAAAERRETILRAAAAVFAQAGYRAAKISDVAALVGVTEPVIFQNFGSKAALFTAVLERAAAEVRASLDDLAGDCGSASGLLAHVLAGLPHARPGQATAGPAGPEHGDAEHAGAGYGVLFADATALTAQPELAEPARHALRVIAAHLVDLIRRAQSDGGVRPDVDPGAAAWLLLSVLSARRLRSAAMPADLEPAVTAIALKALAPPNHRTGSPPSPAGPAPGRPAPRLIPGQFHAP